MYPVKGSNLSPTQGPNNLPGKPAPVPPPERLSQRSQAGRALLGLDLYRRQGIRSGAIAAEHTVHGKSKPEIDPVTMCDPASDRAGSPRDPSRPG